LLGQPLDVVGSFTGSIDVEGVMRAATNWLDVHVEVCAIHRADVGRILEIRDGRGGW
jgi:hypothetical protein